MKVLTPHPGVPWTDTSTVDGMTKRLQALAKPAPTPAAGGQVEADRAEVAALSAKMGAFETFVTVGQRAIAQGANDRAELRTMVDDLATTVDTEAVAPVKKATPRLDNAEERLAKIDAALVEVRGLLSSLAGRLDSVEARPYFIPQQAPPLVTRQPLATGLVAVVPTALGTTNSRVNDIEKELLQIRSKLINGREFT